MLFAKARCHYCGQRSRHPKGTPEFRCSQCEAHNFFDDAGNILDTPASVAARPSNQRESTPLSFTRPLPDTLGHQTRAAFCRTCAQNQHLYNETLSNYLPDESHPQYKQFEAAIPQYKKELEKRYPLVCKDCAPKAQSKIERSDYYALTENAGRLVAATRARGGQPAYRTRDDAGKKAMRAFLNIVGSVLWTGLFTQVAFHLYAVLAIYRGTASNEPELGELSGATIRPSLNECANQSLRLQFSNTCFQLFGNLIPYTLGMAVCGLWYNTGLKHWYHHTYRIEAVKGQKNYFYMQLLTLVVRAWAWFTLSDPAANTRLDRPQQLATHGFVIFFMIVTQLVAQSGIEPVRWSMKGKMMPKPTDVDVLGAGAGSPEEHFTPKASEKDPFRYLRNSEPGPLDVINSVTKRQQKQSAYSRSSRVTAQQPSPDLSDDEDAMETDYQPIMRSSQRSLKTLSQLGPRGGPSTTLSFGGDMSNEVYNMQSRARAQEEEQQRRLQQSRQHQPSPFYGKLPPAPQSMERRLRNPVIVPQEPAVVPLSQQPNFMQKMREGVKPVQFPEKGSSFQPQQAKWNLPGDNKEIGLEERFNKTFSLNDAAPAGQEGKKRGVGLFGGLFGR